MFPRLAWCGSAPLLAGLRASASANVGALPPLAASPVRCGRVPAGARALSSTTAPPAPEAVEPSAVVVPISAAQVRALDVQGVVAFVESLGVDADEAQKLKAQKLDGAALLETTVDELRGYGVLGGPACTIMRAIAHASAVTLTVDPPLGKRGAANNPVKVTLTPADFRIKFVLSGAPLRLVSSDGAVLQELTTLEQAVEASRDGSARLHASRSFGDDLEAVRGFVGNSATALEQRSTRALARDAGVLRMCGPLRAVNSAEHVTISLRRGGALVLQLEADGIVANSHIALLNSAKHAPSLDHVDDVVNAAAKLELMLANFAGVTTQPPEAREQLRGLARVVPFLSGDRFSAGVVARCREKGVGFARPDGTGFAVEPARLA